MLTPASRLLESTFAQPLRWLMAGLGLTLLFASFLPSLKLSTDGSALEPVDSGAVRLTELHRDQFYEREHVLLLLSAVGDGPPVESVRGLRLLKTIHDGLDSLASLGGASVRSLASLVDVVSDGDEVAIGKLLNVIPSDPDALDRLRGRIRQHPLAVGLMLSEDGSSAALYVHLDDAVGRRTSLASIREFVDAHSLDGFELRLTGPVVAEALLGERVIRDLAWQVPLMIVDRKSVV